MRLIGINKFITIVSFLLFTLPSFGQNDKSEKSPQTIQELKEGIEKVMNEEHIPAVGIALVNEDRSVWVESFGKANIEEDIDANDQTLFRIGSTSKMFVSLAILKMQQEGLLSLNDKVRDLVPEIEFVNSWAETNPILVVHLLEHTTGWDDYHNIEYAHNDTALSLKEGLDFHPQSRVSRWIPGTRMAYCNTGPPVAAYIVEKISKKTFENYIQENFFTPIGMKSATFFEDENYKKYGVTTYIGKEPQSYYHVLQRPSGSINATPTDMAKFLQFYINRGKVDSLELISEESLKRMETCMTTDGAKAGLEQGYGLSNYASPYKSFVYQGHNGSVEGAVHGFGYIPEYNVGYSIAVNGGGYLGSMRISKLVMSFQTRNLPNKKINIELGLKDEVKDLSGYYIPINQRSNSTNFMIRVLAIKHIWQTNDTIFTKGLFFGDTIKNIAVNPTQYKSTETGKISMGKIIDPLDGEVVVQFDLAVGSEQILKRISTISLFSQIFILALWIVLMLVSIVYGFIWSIRYFLGKIEGGAAIKVRLWPFMSSLFFLVTFILFQIGMGGGDKYFGGPGFVSISFMLFTIFFALASIMSVVCVVKNHNAEINKLIYWYSVILSVLHVLITFYLLWFDVIGMQVWS